jgi:hypothetical protein
MPNITMPNGDVVTFPDDMPPDRIAALISSKFPNEVQHQLEQSGKADNPLIATGKMAVNAFLSDFPQAFSGLKQQFTEGVAGDPNALEKKIGPDFKINDTSLPIIDQQNILKWGAQRLGLPAANTQATDMLGEYGWPDAAQVSKIEAFIKTPQGKAELIAMLKGQTPDYKPMGTPYDVVQKAQEAGKKERAAIEAGRIPVNVVPNSLIGAVESGVSSVAQMAPAIGASILLRNPLPAMAQAQLLAQGQSYGQARDQGLSPEQAGQYALLSGAAEGLPEAIPVGLLLKEGVGSFLKQAGKQVLAEGIQEGFTELLQIGLDKGYINPDMTWAEAKSRLSTAVIGGAFGGGIMHTAVHGPHSFMTPKPDERPDAGPAAVELDLGAPSPATNSVAPNAMTAEQQAASTPMQVEQAKRLALPAPTIEDEAPSVAVTPPPPGETVREKQSAKTAQLLAAAREVTTPVGAFSVPEVGPTIAGKVNLWRSRTGRNIDAPITVADMQAARVEQPLIDELVISRKPMTKIGTEASAQQAGTISAGINADLNQQRYNDAVAAVRKAGRFTLKTVQDATGITNVNEARAIRDQMVQRGEIIQTKPNTFKLPEQPKTEAAKAAPIATYTVAPAAPETVAVKKDGKIHGVYTTQKEAAAEVRALRAREKETGTQPGRVEVVNGGVDAEGKAIAGRPAFAVYENSYDEAGNSVGRTIVSTHATEEGAANAAKGLNNQPKAQRAAATAATASAKPTRGQPSPAAPLPQVPDVIAGREQEIVAGLDKLAKQRGVPTLGVKVKLVGSITDASTGATVEGSYLNGVVRIALDKLSPDMTTEEIIDALAAVMDHELIHALRDAGLLADGTPAWKILVNYVAQGRHPDTGLTFLQWAAQSPEDGGYSDMSPSIQIEEAMAEAFRYWAKNRRAVGGAPGTVFNQIARWFKNLTSSIPADLFRAVETGSLVRANIKPPASKRMEAVDAMADARAKMTAAATPEEAADAQRDFLRARDQAEADRVGRVGPRTVLGTTPSDEFMIGPRASFDTVEALNAKADTLKLAPTPNYNTPDTGFMRKLADAYQNAKHQPSDTAVFKAYSALTTEVRSLFDTLNVKVVPWRQSGQPYIDQRDLIDDIVNNGEVKMRLSAEMFPAHPTRKHPMQEQSSVVAADGTALTHDDLMRVVTEAFGYAPVASVASEVGDYRAYHTIKGMFSERAQKALPTEMLAQSAWHNYGPKMRLDDGSIASEGALGFVEPVKREFAERKATILPDAVLVEPVQEAALDITGMGEARYSRGSLQTRMQPGGDTPDRIATRVPTTQRSTDNPLTTKLVIDRAAMKVSPEAFRFNTELVKTYPGFRTTATDPDQIADDFVALIRGNLQYLYDRVSPELRQRTKRWYDGARALTERWARDFDLPDYSVAGVIAVLSPQKDWYANVSMAERVLDIYFHMTHGAGRGTMPTPEMAETAARIYPNANNKEKDATALRIAMTTPFVNLPNSFTKAIWLRVYDQTYNSSMLRHITPEGDFIGDPIQNIQWQNNIAIAKAIECIENPSYENVSRQAGGEHKVRNFLNNILAPNAPHGDVTIDTHAVAAALLRPLSSTKAEVVHAWGSSLDKAKQLPGYVNAKNVGDSGANGLYGLYAEAYRSLAKDLGILPRELQSITWEAVRGLFPDTFKKPNNTARVDEIWNSVKAGQLDVNTARQTIEAFAGGVNEPTWLRSGGEGTVAARASSYEGELARSRVHGRGAADGLGTSGRNAGGVEETTAGQGIQGAGVRFSRGVNYGPAEQSRLPSRDRRDGRYSSGNLAPLAGAPQVKGASGPDARLVAVAEQYARDNGIDLRRQAKYVKVDPARAERIADAYEAMSHAPNDPKVRAAYNELIRQTVAQYRALEKAGYKFWFIDLSTPEGQDYSSTPWNAMRDIRANQSMGVFPTEDGFGTKDDFSPDANPLLADTGIRWPWGSPNGPLRTVYANDLFRAVHDAFGHGIEGSGFRADGEENAWQAHVRLFTGDAVGAITTETRGQNSWLNYGPFGENNRTAKVEDTVFADQKTGLMPEWAWFEGRAGNMGEMTAANSYNIGSPQFYEMLDEVMPGGKHYGKADRSAAAVVMPVTTSAPAFSRDYDGNVFFGGDIAYQQLQMTRDGDRGAVLTYMAPEDFLRLADQQPMREQRLFNEAAGAGYKFNTMPSLVVESGKTGAVPVLNSDGVAIARALLGQAKTIPVVLYPSGNGQIENVDALTGNDQSVDILAFYEFDIERRGPRHNLSSVAFNAWFKQSAVVDEAGAPKRVYHNTKAKESFGVFATHSSEFGSHFGAPEQANDRVPEKGHGYPVYLSVQNPIRLADRGAFEIIDVAQQLRDMGIIDRDQYDAVRSYTVNGIVMLQDILTEKGYDGVVYLNRREGFIVSDYRDWNLPEDEFKSKYPEAQDSYIVFQPTQVKSAIANRGTWSSADPDIRYSRGRDRTRVTPSGGLAYSAVHDRVDGSLGEFFRNLGRSKAGVRVGENRFSIFDYRIATQDSFLEVKDIYGKLAKNGIVVPSEIHAYVVELSIGSTAAFQIKEREKAFVQPLVEAIGDGVRAKRFTYDEVQNFLYALHAPERNAYLRERGSKSANPSGMSETEAAKIIADAKAKGTFAELMGISRKVDDIVTDINMTRVRTGQITPSVLAGSPFRNWVPLRDTDDVDPYDEISKAPRADGVGRAFASWGKRPDKRMFGRTSKAGDIVANLISLQAVTVMRGERARVGKALIDTLTTLPNAKDVLRDDLEIIAKPPTKLAYGADGMIREIVDPDYRGNPDIVVFKVDGKEVVLRSGNPRLVAALKGPLVEQMGPILQLVSQAARFRASILTSRDPNFALTNMSRDAIEAMINAGQYAIPGLAAKMIAGIPKSAYTIGKYQLGGKDKIDPKALAAKPVQDRTLEEFYYEMDANGWLVSFLAPQDIKRIMQKVQRDVGVLTGTRGAVAKAGKAIDSVIDAWDGINNVSEGAVRLAFYAEMRKAGASITDAGVAAKNLTINFNKGGTLKPIMNANYLFSSVVMNGVATTGRMLTNKRGRRILTSVVAFGFLLDALNRALSDDDDDNRIKDYDQLTEDELNRNVILPTHVLWGKDLPLPIAIGPIGAFFNLGRNLSRAIDGITNKRQPVSPVASVFNAVTSTVEALNPVGDSNRPANLIAPWYLDPVIDLYANRNWADMSIVPQTFDNTKPESQKYYRTTDDIYINVAQGINRWTGGNESRKGWFDFSPEQYKYVADFLTGGTGRFFLDTKYAMTEALPLAVEGKGDLIQTGRIPFLKRFATTTAVERGGSDIFYKLKGEVQTTENELKSDNPETRAAGRTRVAAKGSVRGAFNQAEGQLKALRMQLTAAQQNKTMASTARLAKIEEIKNKMQDVMDKAVKRYYDALENAP